MELRKIISGGQTGADQGALSACVQCKFPYGGWVPKGRRDIEKSMGWVPKGRQDIEKSMGGVPKGRPDID